MKIIELSRSVTDSNDRDAARLRAELLGEGRLLINLMSGPGAGKTTLLRRLIRDFSANGISTGVVEADIDGDIDARRIEEAGGVSVQAHTDGMCHMDAGMTERALRALPERTELIFLENVGNLICPAEYDTGASLNVMILSVPEGDDKPLKYPLMFRNSDVLVISKTDALPWFSFSIETCRERALRLNPDIRIFPVSAKTGEGMEALEEYLLRRLETVRAKT